MRIFRVSLVVCALVMEASAQITDSLGVILIDQQHASVGGIGPSDASGFPVTISSPGSYKLTSNLTVRDLNTTVIAIYADHVTLDLNGFSIIGPNVCQLGQPCPNGTGSGIRVFSGSDTTVKNGSVTGMGASGIYLATGTVRNVTASHNGFIGVFMDGGSISDSFATHNGTYGLRCFGGGLVTRSVATSNGQLGLLASTGCAYSGNVFMGNSLGPVSGGLNLGQNSCDGAVCP